MVSNNACADYSSESFLCEEASVNQVSGCPILPQAPSNNFFQTYDYSNDIIETPYDYQDNVQYLDVGKTYKYCVSSIAKNYMYEAEFELY